MKGINLIHSCNDSQRLLQNSLEKAQSNLRTLEKKASGYDSVSIPMDLKIALEDKQKELARLMSKVEAIFEMQFVDRQAEMDAIQSYRQHNLYVQIYGSGGMGKSFLLKEIYRQLKTESYTVILIDFANTHSHCLADTRALMIEFYRQLGGIDSPIPLDNNGLLHYAGKCLANTFHTALILDNADQADKRLLEWLRSEFFEAMMKEGDLWVLASGQYIIPEWQGHRAGRTFRALPLSSFEDPLIVESIVNNVVSNWGSLYTLQKRETRPDLWKQDLRAMTTQLTDLACGHPLALTLLLKEAVKKDGLYPQFFIEHRSQLIARCLSPMISERILPTLDSFIREAFRSLCIFRAVWPGLIRALLAEGDWPPMTDDAAPPDYWWRLLQTTPLIGDVNPRQLYPLSPIVRRLIALVLEYEDPDLFRARHARARAIYSQMAADAHVALLQRAACWLEALFHAAKSGDDAAVQATLALLPGLQALPAWEEVQPQVTAWWDEDAELRALAAHFLDPDWSIG